MTKMMLWWLFFVLGSGLCQINNGDFSMSLHGYEFIYHNKTNVMLVVDDNNCYFHAATDIREDLEQHLVQLESDLVTVIENNASGLVNLSSLSAVRDRYQDRLADFHCLDKTIFEIGELVLSCPQDWKPFQDSCYKFHEHGHKTWDDAKSTCDASENGRGRLLEIESTEENDFVVQLLMSYSEETFWTGFTDKAVEGQFVSSYTGRALNYTYWAHGEPNNGNGSENCAVVTLDKDHGHWDDRPCTHHYHYVCELSLSVSRPHVQMPCRSEWTLYGQHCYKVFASHHTWDTALDMCENEGVNGTLAEIHTADENTMIIDLARSTLGNHDVWIGAEDKAQEGVWVYPSSQQPLNFTFWDHDRPNIYALDQDCAFMDLGSGGQWHDCVCHSSPCSHGFVCQLPALV